jgi:hypothetical protein
MPIAFLILFVSLHNYTGTLRDLFAARAIVDRAPVTTKRVFFAWHLAKSVPYGCTLVTYSLDHKRCNPLNFGPDGSTIITGTGPYVSANL